MSSFDRSLARALDFGDLPARATSSAEADPGAAQPPLASPPTLPGNSAVPDHAGRGSHVRSWAVRARAVHGAPDATPTAIVPDRPGKYRVLEQRRRRAQITARRLLDLAD